MLRSQKIVIFFFLILLGGISSAQNVDSLKKIVNSTIPLEEKENAYWALCEELAWEEPTLTLEYTEKLSRIEAIQSDSVRLMKIIRIQGKSQRSFGNYVKSLELYQINYDYNKYHRNKLEQAEAASQLGIMNLFNGNVAISQKYLLETYDIYKLHGTPSQIASSNNALANYYSTMDQNEKAFERYYLALEAFEEADDIRGRSNVHTNLGLILMQSNKFEESEINLLEAGRLDSVRESPYSLGFFHDFMGLLRKRQKRYNEAEAYMMTALTIRKGLESHYNICETELSLAQLYLEKEEYNKAITHAESIFQFQDEQQALYQQQSAFDILSEAYEELSDFQASLLNFKEYKTISDSIYSSDMISEIAEKDALFEKTEQDSEIELLNAKNVASEKLINSKTRTITIGAIALASIIVLAFFLYRILTKFKRQQLVLTQAVQDKDLLIKEIHHRVKNNLQIVSSLLSLQSRYISDEVALDAINTSRTRIRSIALLHQNLYSNDNLKSVKIKNYFDNLENLYESHKMSPNKNIVFHSEIDDIELDIDFVVPLGLIANELITNSHKHAFENLESGRINLSIKKIGNEVILDFSDDGNGIPFSSLPHKPKSLGLKLIGSFAKKLNAKIEMMNENGTTFQMKFRIKKIV